jgi:hypothetical protein
VVPQPGVPCTLTIGNRGILLAVAGAVAAALVVFAVYWPAAHNGFVWDDWSVVVDLSRRVAPLSWLEAVLRPPSDYAALFRPLTMLTFLLQLWAGHAEPLPFHVANVILHATNVLWLTLVAWCLLDDDAARPAARPALAVLCGLIYGMHPALAEPVVWISARSDLLLTGFLSLALLLDRVLPAAGWNRATAVGVLFLAAALCKETAVGFLAALPLVHLALVRPAASMHWADAVVRALSPHYRVYAALIGASLLYLAVRFAVSGPTLGMGMEGVRNNPAPYIESFGQHALVVIASLAVHVWSAIWPFQNMAPGRHLPLPIDIMEVLPAVAGSTGVVLLALLAACARGARRVPGLLFLAFVAALLPVANIVPIPAVVVPVEIGVASRYVTFPLLFACLAVPFVLLRAEASLVRRVRYRETLLWLVVCTWLVASAANVRGIIPLWNNDAILNSWALHQGGPSFWRYANYGIHYLRTGDIHRAREAFLAAVALRDDKHSAWVWGNLGVLELHFGNTARAVGAFRRALELDPGDIPLYHRLGMAQRAVGDLKAAARTLEAGVERIQATGRPHEEEGRLRSALGIAYRDLGRPDDAIAQLKAALALAQDPQERAAAEAALRGVAPSR